jgi:phospholipase C
MFPAALLLAGCSGTTAPLNSSISQQPMTPTVPPSASSKIQHIVVIMQENRSFDNLFNGFPGADTVTSGMNYGQTVKLQSIPLEQGTDVDHSHPSWWADWDNGAMDGFAHENYAVPNLAYAYVPQSETVPYWTLAQRYTLGDRMFQSNTGPSFVAHQYMIAGQSGGADEDPDSAEWGCDAPSSARVPVIGPNGTDLPGVYPCFNYQTMADLLDAKGVTWRYYAPGSGVPSGFVFSAFEAIQQIRFGTDWAKDVISPNTQVLTDIANGQLAQVTWIMPAFSYSDHPGPGSTNEGPDWVASITNAIGASPFWDSTVIFIAWDDWGGWYDHVPPPQVDNMGLGFRVPVIVVSPYAKAGYVSHTSHESSGFLKYTEEVFGLPSLGTRDVSADDFGDCFDYTQTPQPYVQIQLTYPGPFFQHNKDQSPPDDD